MPLNPEYQARAEHNERLLAEFDQDTTDYLDWMVTIAFYVAVRYVDACFFPELPANHIDRLEMVRTDSRTYPIRRSYRELYQKSIESRYQLVSFSPAEVNTLIENRMNHVKGRMLAQ